MASARPTGCIQRGVRCRQRRHGAVPEAVAGRAQSTQAVFRGVGTALALIGGGLLVTLGKPAPFIAGGALLG